MRIFNRISLSLSLSLSRVIYININILLFHNSFIELYNLYEYILNIAMLVIIRIIKHS